MQLYARVFVQILDSSIAEDFTCRHVFEDMFKVCVDGVVDMTRTSLARRFNVPLDELNRCILKLESPDPLSRDPDYQGRRIERLDPHRDWGWRIINWEKYELLKTRADVALRVQRHRDAKKPSKLVSVAPGSGTAPSGETPDPASTPPSAPAAPKNPPMARGVRKNRPDSIEEVVEQGRILGVPELSCRKFWLHYDSTAMAGANDDHVWVTGEKGEKPVGNWLSLLKKWQETERALEQQRKEQGRPESAAIAVPLEGEEVAVNQQQA